MAQGAEGVLIATGELKSGKAPKDDRKFRRKIAALCFAQHFFLEARYGDHHVWVLDLPFIYKDWPSIQIAKANPGQIDTLIKLSEGRLEEKHREQLGQAVTHAAAYTEKAHAMLSQAQPGNRAWEIAKRWFADEETSDAMLQKFIGEMMSGLRKFINVLRSNKIVLLDHPQLRGKIMTQDDRDLFEAEAFVFKGNDPVSAIYIQQVLFKENPIVKGPRNFARLLVHEIAHRELKTEDHKSATNGIKPTKGRLPFAQTCNNSDSWAFCVMDLADMLTPLEIARARII
ncbi:hypothetical protein V8J88_17035 [Massilia sp. W12]|uniref:hypothetical protein n=1 Tax=Massilia sp. W12 TaxID=3126507 RepID=UPI0030CEAA20